MTDALLVAKRLAAAGAPIFIARPVVGPDGAWDPEGGASGYKLPLRWQDTRADPAVVDKWQPGQALCMVTGVAYDVVDVDPRNGGDLAALDGDLPRVYGRATTPSDGIHLFVKTLGVRKCVIAPGIDLQAGAEDGGGRGFVFLAPTVKLSKTTGAFGSYDWVEEPSEVEDGDDSGAVLRLLAYEKNTVRPRGADYDGPGYKDLDVGRASWADRYVAGVVGRWGEKLAEAAGWADGVRDEKGRGWEALARDFAWALARLAAAPWTGLTVEGAAELYDLILPGDIADDPRCSGKWDAGLVARAEARAAEEPPWAGFGDVVVGQDGRDLPELPIHWEDGRVAPWMAYRGLQGLWCWAAGLRWMRWDGRRWVARTEESVREAVRLVVLKMLAQAVQQENRKAVEGLRGLLGVGRIGAVVSLMRRIVEVEASSFDLKPDLLNCGNGVVDLRSGELWPHDPALLLTRITDVAYVPGTRSRDWDQCLDALDPEVSEWMQVRWGQAATGWPTSDDVLPVMQGAGANGKSTQLVALERALGDHMVQVPAKLLMANPSDHPTELMTLRGARVAYVDETPEAGTLNVARLKAVLGQGRVTARAIRQDNVTWVATHSLFLSTNYVPNIAETDHGTWRRLALVRYERQYERDDRFRARMARGSGGVAEAVLAWVVDGARAWYDADMVLPAPPEKVEADTLKWRRDSDLVMGWIGDRVVFEQGVGTPVGDVSDDLNEWLKVRGQRAWSQKTLTARLEGHQLFRENGVARVRLQSDAELEAVRRGPDAVTSIPARPWVWWGLRIDVSDNGE
jgi:putative DNA primase/helicase